MSSDETDRNLLFGVLALQNNIIDHQAFVAALRDWAADKRRSLARILVERGSLDPSESPLVDLLVERHLKKHGGNPHATLGAVAHGVAREAIGQVDDHEVQRSVLTLAPVETMVPAVVKRSRHTLSRVLGEGGLGKVWVARDTDLNRDVALKEILPEHSTHPEMWRWFCKEAQVTGQLEHPNIVPVYELGRRPEDDQPFYTMRLLGGRTLARAIADYHEGARLRGPDPPVRFALLQAFANVCQAIGYAHSRGVIHRDLKPLNVMLGDYGETVVIDWGLAKILGQSDDTDIRISSEALHGATQAGQIVGSPLYMAPEQAEGRNDLVDQRTDIYGLGAILFEILTGRTPFEGKNSDQVLAKIVSEAIPRARALDRSIPPALDAICARATARDRASRYGSAIDFARDLQCWMTDEPVSAYREGTVERVARWARRHRSWVRAGAAALVVVAIVSIVAAFLVRAASLREQMVQNHERDRQLKVRLDAQDLVFAGQADALAGRWPEAALKLTGALNRIAGESGLDDLKGRASQLLAEAERENDARQSRQRSRERLTHFVRSHDDAVFHGTLFVGLDADGAGQGDSRTATAAAREALQLYGIETDGSGPVVADSWLSAAENTSIAEGCYELLLLMAEAAEPPTALRALDRAASLGRDSRALHVQRFRVFTALGKTQQADVESKRAQSLEPVDAFDLFLAGRAAYQRDDLSEALAYLRNALTERPNHVWAQYLMALCLLRQGRPAEARAHLTACLSRRPDDFAWGYLVRGYACSELGDFKAAEADFRKSLALLPDRASRYGTLVNRGRSRIYQKRLDAAVADLTEAVSLFPDRYEGRINLAIAQQARGDRTAALAELDQAITRHPDLAAAYRNRARLLLEQGKTDEAARDFSTAVLRERHQPRHLADDETELAALHFKAKRYRNAIIACDRALSALPDHPTALRLKAETLIALNEPAPAVALYDRFLAKEPPSADVYRARGLLRLDLGRPGEAIEDFTHALEMAPKSSNILAKRGWIYVLDALKLARKDFDGSIRLNPDNADAYNGRAYASLRAGDLVAAVKDAESAVQLAPKEPAILYNASCVYSEALGRINARVAAPAGTDFQGHALTLLRDALESLPPAKRASFWSANVETDSALDPVRDTDQYREMKAKFQRKKD